MARILGPLPLNSYPSQQVEPSETCMVHHHGLGSYVGNLWFTNGDIRQLDEVQNRR
jgi:hypothetical protein